jgi:hypothetical protein
MAGLRKIRIGSGRNAIALELERGPAGFLRPCLFHLVLPRLGIFRPLHRRHGAIEPHAVAEPAAQQVAHRRLENPSRQVPQRDLDAAGRRDRDAGQRARAL